MKIYLTTLIFLFSIRYYVFPAEYYTVERLGVNFYGVCHNDNIVIAYGNGGVILVSKDKGKNWEQRQIFNDSIRISKIINLNNLFFGFCHNNTLFKLNEYGYLEKSGSSNSNAFSADIAASPERLFIRRHNSDIGIFDFNLSEIGTIPFDTSLLELDLCWFNKKLFLSTGNSKILAFDSENDYKPSSIDISGLGKQASDFRVENNNIYVSIDKKVYKSHDGLSWTQMTNEVSDYNVKNDEIYYLKINKNVSWNVSWVDFYTVDGDMNVVKINNDSINRYVNPIISGWEFIDDNNIIAVGIDKVIYRSNDSGKSWDLKSYFISSNNSIRGIIWLDSNNWFCTISNYIFKTTNSGTTWLPQMFTDTLIKKIDYFHKFYMDKDGYGFAYSGHNIVYPDSTKNINFIYTKDYGNTFINFWQEAFKSKLPTTAVVPIKTDSGYQVFHCPQIYQDKNKFTLIMNLDTNFKYTGYYKLDSIRINVLNTNNDIYTALGEEYSYPDYDSMKILIIISKDKGKSWTKKFYINVYGDYPQSQVWTNNKMFLRTQNPFTDSFGIKTTYTTIHYVDVEEEDYNFIFRDTLFTAIPLYFIDNKFYFSNRYNQVLFTDDYTDPSPEFDTVFFSNYIKAWTGLNKDSLIYIFGLDSDGNKNIIKTTKQTITGIEEQEIESESYIFATPPYPSPTMNKVKVQIFESSPNDISSARIQIYDFMGNKVSDGSDVERIAHSFYQGEIAWDCSSVAPGVYFINFDFGTVRTTVPVVVAR